MAWYTNMIKGMGEFHRSTDALKKSGYGTLTTSLEIGLFYHYWYDPKLKDELPYYDKFPIVLPINYYSDSFLGLNLHYLPQGARMQFYIRLLDLCTNTAMAEDTKILARYEVLKDTQKYRAFKPCIKKYLYSHVMSKFLQINPSHWEMAIYLPVQQFRKGSPW